MSILNDKKRVELKNDIEDYFEILKDNKSPRYLTYQSMYSQIDKTSITELTRFKSKLQQAVLNDIND